MPVAVMTSEVMVSLFLLTLPLSIAAILVDCRRFFRDNFPFHYKHETLQEKSRGEASQQLLIC